MKDEMREFLDGERPRSSLALDAREEAEAWDRLLTVLREDVPGPAPLWLEGAVMAEVAVARPGIARRAAAWVLRPSLRLSPLGVGLAAAAVATLLLVPWRATPPVMARSPRLLPRWCTSNSYSTLPGLGRWPWRGILTDGKGAPASRILTAMAFGRGVFLSSRGCTSTCSSSTRMSG